ncbi:MAG: glycosyltransferase family 39 protein [Bryobacteraceae bacterium]
MKQKLKHSRTRKGKALAEAASRRAPGAGIGALSKAARAAKKHALPLAAVIGVTLLAYINSFHAPFLVDNVAVILGDSRIRAVTPENLHRILTFTYWEVYGTGLYRPLTTLSFLLNYAVFGNAADPYGYHCLNFLLHAVNIALVYALGLAIFKRTPAAVLLSALWGLAPVLTESVTSIVGRSDLLAAFAVLAGLLCHRKAVEAMGARKGAWLAALGLAAAVGIFSKESAIVLLAVLAIYDVTYGRAASWRSRIPSYAVAAVPCLVYLYVRSLVIANVPHMDSPFYENPLLGAGFWTARMTAIKAMGRYLGLLVWPAHLSWDYGYNAVPLFGWRMSNWEDWQAIVALAGCAAAASIAARAWRTRKPLLFGIAFFFATMFPTSNLLVTIGATMAERFLYLPAVGFAVAAVWVLDALWRRLPAGPPAYRKVARAAVAILLIALAGRTYARNGDWLDPRQFWLSAAAAAPGSYKTNMAAATSIPLDTSQDVARSLNYADRALAIVDGLPDSENSPGAYQDAGILYLRLGDKVASGGAAAKPSARPDAPYWYRKSLTALLRSERIALLWDARYRAGNAGRGDQALTSLPSDLYLELGRAYLRLRDTPHALAAFERGRTLESTPELLGELASLYRANGEPHKAALALMESLAANAGQPEVGPMLVNLYQQIDPQGCAVSRQDGMPVLNPDCPLVHNDICTATRNLIGNYLRKGQQFEADSVRGLAERDLGCAPNFLN